MFKVAFIGAGSIGFTRKLLQDLLAVPEFRSIEVAFCDINEQNLDMVTQLCQRDIDANGLKIRIQATTDRREAFKDAKYVINTVRVGGLEAFETDINIPLKYGVDQCVGDTICAGGIMYAQRGIAAVLDFCRDIREVAAPGCLFLNYSNPNAMITWACLQYGGVKTVGLCHGVQDGVRVISEALGADKKDIDIICAGINHQTWYISVKHKGREITGAELLSSLERHEYFSKSEKVRIDMLRHFGFFSTESNGHLSEYLPWYRKNAEEVNRWIGGNHWIEGETGGYLRVCTESRNWFDTDFPNWLKEKPATFGDRSPEHGSYIIEALETGRCYRGHFNVMNHGRITNLPDDAIVEVPGYVDYNGISIPVVGDLPLGCAAVCNASISVQRLGVAAAVAGDDWLLRQALMMDPLTGAICTTSQISQMADELLIAQGKWLPQYAKSIAAAKERRKSGQWIDLPEYRGAARKEARLPEEVKEEISRIRDRAKDGEMPELS